MLESIFFIVELEIVLGKVFELKDVIFCVVVYVKEMELNMFFYSWYINVVEMEFWVVE